MLGLLFIILAALVLVANLYVLETRYLFYARSLYLGEGHYLFLKLVGHPDSSFTIGLGTSGVLGREFFIQFGYVFVSIKFLRTFFKQATN